ncbi:MAG TPA: F0F1 ATP synthase subunit A [Anaerolineaceae bacterium]|nr:F0F1 ATP synthase subunit A [Anaerolineaceae bacterium]
MSVNLIAPVLPHIQVAPERLAEAPLVTLPVIGPLYLTNTLTTNLLVVAVIILLAYLVKRSLSSGDMVPRGISGAMEALIEAMYNLTEGTTGAKWARIIFPWFATFLIYILVANMIRLLPIFETFGPLHHISEGGNAVQQLAPGIATVVNQPGEFVVTPIFRGLATDLNFTAALALVSVIATQIIGVQAGGLRYFTRFFNYTTLFNKPFFGAIDFAVGLLELISTLALILSFSFRLFGNIFAGTVLFALVAVLVPVFMPSAIQLFEFFIGLIQAFVFGMLTMVFMSQAVAHTAHGEGGEH